MSVERLYIDLPIIRSAIEPGTANLQLDSIEPRPADSTDFDLTNGLFDDYMSFANFDTPLSHTTKPGPVGSIPTSTKSKTWQDVE